MFTWKAFFVALFLYWVAGSLGIGMAYHRLLTHRGYKCPKWVEYFLTICATMALEGGPIFWVATHRVHHQLSDKPGDPHSPRDGGWWAHMGWILTGKTFHNKSTELLAYVPDLRKDKFHMWISEYHWVPTTTVAILLLAFGGWSMVLWGFFLRTVVLLHSTWFVNSATHMWGSKRFTTDRRFAQPVVGGLPQLRRRLAQQSSRASAVGAAWTGLVRGRHELVRDQVASGFGIGVGREAAQAGLGAHSAGCHAASSTR